MSTKLILQGNFEKPETDEKKENILYFSKRSPFKDTCNEDALAIIEKGKDIVLAIADGAGGHPKGEEAAKIVLETLEQHIKNSKAGSLRASIVDAIEDTNKKLISDGIGAKTTITVCEISDNKARGYQVGDSTLVICGQKGKLKYRSLSHSPVGYGIEAGLIGEKEALEHPDLHYISNLVGDADMKIEIGPEIDLNSNDSVFLASDGIFDNFPPDEIIEKVRKGGIPDIAVDLMTLINEDIYAEDSSKKDDISFILFKNN